MAVVFHSHFDAVRIDRRTSGVLDRADRFQDTVYSGQGELLGAAVGAAHRRRPFDVWMIVYLHALPPLSIMASEQVVGASLYCSPMQRSLRHL